MPAHHDSGAGPKNSGQWGSRRKPLLQPVAVDAEFKSDPAENLVGLQQQPVDGFAQDRSGSTRPMLPLGHTVADDTQFVAIELDHREHPGGQNPLTITFVEQVFLADPLGQHRGQLGGQVGRVDVVRERYRQ